MEKSNIAELLKDCPKGMELYSPIFGKVYLDKVRPHLAIVVITDKEQGDFREEFLYDGRYGMNGECMLFPSKSKTTWKGFHRPFKDGDIVAVTMYPEGTWIGIFKQYEKTSLETHCSLDTIGEFHDIGYKNHSLTGVHLATEEEKQKLFQAIKANGNKWNAETKTLEKLIKPKFKVGDIIQYIDTYKVKITEINIDDECYGYESIIAKGIGGIPFNEQDNWKLVPNKFNINTLKPFDKVLVRDNIEQKWTLDFFSFMDKDAIYPFICVGHYITQCIPSYKGNEHLLGTTNDCNEYFKTWK